MDLESPPPTLPLESRRCAIVVGASSGIGAALVNELTSDGFYVAAVARREDKLSELCNKINASIGNGAKALFYTHDVTDFDQTPELFQRIARDLGGLNLIIYAAGAQPFVAGNEYDFDKDLEMVQVNLLGAMSWLDQAATRFDRAGAGHIVGISSIAADRGRRLNPTYNASKAGLETYLEALRNRLTRHGITVTTIKPGFVDTVKLENAPNTFWVISPAEAASQIYRAIRRKKQTVYIPGRWRFVSLIVQLIPSFLFRRMNF